MIGEKELFGICLATFLLTTGVGATIPALAQKVYEMSNSDKLVSMVIGIWGFAFMIFSTTSGFLLNLLGGKKVSYIGLIGASFSGLLMLFSRSVRLLALSRFLTGASEALTLNSFITSITFEPADRREGFLGLLYASMGLGLFFGPFLYTSLMKSSPIMGFLSLTTFPLVSIFLAPMAPAKISRRIFALNFEKSLLGPYFLLLFIGILDGTFQGSGISLLKAFGWSPIRFGEILSLYFFCSLTIQLTMPFLARISRADNWALSLSGVSSVISVFLLLFKPDIFPAFFSFSLGISVALCSIASTSLISELSLEEDRALMIGISSSVYSFGYFISSILADFSNLRMWYVLMLAFLFIQSTLIRLFLKKNS